MTFVLEIAQPGDAARITQIHMDAFSSNALIRAIHAVDGDLSALRKAVEKRALDDMQDSKTTVIVVRDVESSAMRNIIGFAKWVAPIYPGEPHSTPSWNLAKTTNWEILGPWIAKEKKAEEEIISTTPHWGTYFALHTSYTDEYASEDLTYLAVDADYAKQGVGTMMVKWALDQCEADGCPTFVTSTVDSVSFYEKLGFKESGRISIDLVDLNKGGSAGVYEEVVCAYTPRKRELLGVADT